ncbi:exopolysaccharide biosynthesis protein [Vreelandella venusta]|uniref:Exopolysaccharide biosynthesis protein n=1 Tax=Vreelandella venusta TaxID=44935 RepID=A0ABX2BBJ2_9GAMM|nr:exopolysaccharide biosynthesis protein [Halomonas venusta]AZM97293.1 exopolysaccharide biosynthesis protein [Halomonas venusta]MDW0358671.1 exopolysaccharide biosynthesis protein [Halomonas venusta]MDX1714001.1 exopolysaccharide biosynthesis protein [Halomonas venusta]NPT31480.1 exopolysaccharide biosynthesis protein [Halomonas venusta]QPI63572.1 exopolysaccharide biosynthesis protein [Halomonas venusta]
MSDMQDASNLTELINTMERMEREKAKVSVDDVVHAVGRRSFGPLLLLAGLITLAPIIGDIPGMPTLMAALVLLTSVQLLLGRETFWLPKWLLNRSLSRNKFDKAIHYMKKPARWVDSLLGVRLAWMTGYIGIRVTAVMCLFIALAMPPMEFIPFSANGAGLALTLFGLGLVARDGIMLSLGFLLTGATLTVVLINVL